MAKMLKIEGFKEYSNDINDLSAKEFVSFFPVVSNSRANISSLVDFTKDEVKPSFVYNELISSFSKEGEFVLDVFSGEGNSILLANELGRNVVGIEKERQKVESFNKKIEEDMHLANSNNVSLFQGQALEILESKIANDFFDFSIIDSPSFRSIEEEHQSVQNYACFLNNVLFHVASKIKENRYIALIAQDIYLKGKYNFISSLIKEPKALTCVGTKIYYREANTSKIINTKVYCPNINHFNVLIFRKNGY